MVWCTFRPSHSGVACVQIHPHPHTVQYNMVMPYTILAGPTPNPTIALEVVVDNRLFRVQPDGDGGVPNSYFFYRQEVNGRREGSVPVQQSVLSKHAASEWNLLKAHDLIDSYRTASDAAKVWKEMFPREWEEAMFAVLATRAMEGGKIPRVRRVGKRECRQALKRADLDRKDPWEARILDKIDELEGKSKSTGPAVAEVAEDAEEVAEDAEEDATNTGPAGQFAFEQHDPLPSSSSGTPALSESSTPSSSAPTPLATPSANFHHAALQVGLPGPLQPQIPQTLLPPQPCAPSYPQAFYGEPAASVPYHVEEYGGGLYSANFFQGGSVPGQSYGTPQAPAPGYGYPGGGDGGYWPGQGLQPVAAANLNDGGSYYQPPPQLQTQAQAPGWHWSGQGLQVAAADNNGAFSAYPGDDGAFGPVYPGDDTAGVQFDIGGQLELHGMPALVQQELDYVQLPYQLGASSSSGLGAAGTPSWTQTVQPMAGDGGWQAYPGVQPEGRWEPFQPTGMTMRDFELVPLPQPGAAQVPVEPQPADAYYLLQQHEEVERYADDIFELMLAGQGVAASQ